MHNITPLEVYGGTDSTALEMNKKLLLEFSDYEVRKINNERKIQELKNRRL